MTPEYLRERIEQLKTGSGRRFVNPELQQAMPREDFDLCTAADIFSFVIRALRRENYFDMMRQEV